jgi:Tfp pilus assembly protein PilN
MGTEEMIIAIAALLLGGGVLTGAAWWVVSGVFQIRSRLVALEGEIALLKAQIENIHVRCHGRETWLREMSGTLARVDKNVVRLATKMDLPSPASPAGRRQAGVEIEE